MCKVLVVSDIYLYRQGLSEMLNRDGRVEVCGGVAAGAEAFDLVSKKNPHVVLMDMAVPDGIETMSMLSIVSPAAKVIALGVTENREDILACAEAGAAGYVCRQSSLNDLVEAIEGALCGELNCSPRVAGALFQRLGALRRGNVGNGEPPQLTPRETELCQLLAEGLANQEIASQLGIQLSTVKAHVHNVLEKLDARNRGEAVAKLRRLGRLLPRRSPGSASASITPGTDP